MRPTSSGRRRSRASPAPRQHHVSTTSSREAAVTHVVSASERASGQSTVCATTKSSRETPRTHARTHARTPVSGLCGRRNRAHPGTRPGQRTWSARHTRMPQADGGGQSRCVLGFRRLATAAPAGHGGGQTRKQRRRRARMRGMRGRRSPLAVELVFPTSNIQLAHCWGRYICTTAPVALLYGKRGSTWGSRSRKAGGDAGQHGQRRASTVKGGKCGPANSLQGISKQSVWRRHGVRRVSARGQHLGQPLPDHDARRCPRVPARIVIMSVHHERKSRRPSARQTTPGSRARGCWLCV